VGGHVSGIVIPTYVRKQEKVLKQPKKNDNYVRNTGSQPKGKDAKSKKKKKLQQAASFFRGW